MLQKYFNNLLWNLFRNSCNIYWNPLQSLQVLPLLVNIRPKLNSIDLLSKFHSQVQEFLVLFKIGLRMGNQCTSNFLWNIQEMKGRLKYPILRQFINGTLRRRNLWWELKSHTDTNKRNKLVRSSMKLVY